MRKNKENIQAKSQAQTSGTISPKVHSIGKAIDPNLRPEKQVIWSVVTSQTHILPGIKTVSHIKPRISQGRAGIKKKMLRFPVSQPYDKSE